MSESVFSGPEPCITSFKTGRCYSPIACAAFGYCRDRNLKYGIPDKDTAEAWRLMASELSRPAGASPGDGK